MVFLDNEVYFIGNVSFEGNHANSRGGKTVLQQYVARELIHGSYSNLSLKITLFFITLCLSVLFQKHGSFVLFIFERIVRPENV